MLLAHQHVLARLDVGADDLLPVRQHPLEGGGQRLRVGQLVGRQMRVPVFRFMLRFNLRFILCFVSFYIRFKFGGTE